MGKGSCNLAREALELEKAPQLALEAFKKAKLNYELITEQDRVDWLCRGLERVDSFSIDFETTSRDGEPTPEYGRIRLIQIGVETRKGSWQYILDLDQVDPGPLVPHLRNPRKEKLIHYSHFEQQWARVHLGTEIMGVYDTCFTLQSVHKELERIYNDPKRGPELVEKIWPGWEKKRVNLAAACLEHHGFELPKEERASDWSEPVLTEAQLEYAALDVAVLPQIAKEAKQLAKVLGIEGRVRWRCKKAREEAIEAWSHDQMDRRDESRALCWELAEAESREELDQIWSTSKTRVLALHNRIELSELYTSRRLELNWES